MNKINELLNDENSILVFDVDGVLATLTFGEYNHFITDEEWEKYTTENINLYTEEKVSKKMQQFISKKNKEKIYVITSVENKKEFEFKKEFLNKYYGIIIDNIFSVKTNSFKTNELIEIKNKYPNINNHNIIMIDDSIEVLNDIMNKTDFTTVHISSFLDL